jgi:cytochrome b subunit of formate dehydrogenase
MRNDMNAVSVLRYDKNKLRQWFHRWFGTNRGTHWTVAGSVAVIIFGGYLIYNGLNGNPTTTLLGPAAERNLHPMTPGPFPLQR